MTIDEVNSSQIRKKAKFVRVPDMVGMQSTLEILEAIFVSSFSPNI